MCGIPPVHPGSEYGFAWGGCLPNWAIDHMEKRKKKKKKSWLVLHLMVDVFCLYYCKDHLGSTNTPRAFPSCPEHVSRTKMWRICSAHGWEVSDVFVLTFWILHTAGHVPDTGGHVSWTRRSMNHNFFLKKLFLQFGQTLSHPKCFMFSHKRTHLKRNSGSSYKKRLAIPTISSSPSKNPSLLVDTSRA